MGGYVGGTGTRAFVGRARAGRAALALLSDAHSARRLITAAALLLCDLAPHLQVLLLTDFHDFPTTAITLEFWMYSVDGERERCVSGPQHVGRRQRVVGARALAWQQAGAVSAAQ